ncbi:hypothetical protein DKG77_10885 [Flagellimonas aquimarina]|uniref:DUF4249 domain-containing protein n=1 Tax=Flagellimonas aquimarina TaxID=2201895 RepID=A0A316L3E7_9FLAO|nr:DUF4249 domain-containing protein [Allomuricauda koreensis]PWL38743.1 hypothetical protein DKG77_10885 [Allomuricauda koreensis]
MKLLKIHSCFLVVISVALLSFGCVEEFIPKTAEFNDILVVEANVTNEMKHHKIYLNRTYSFEDETAFAETNAQVMILEDSNNQYMFEESEPGVYTSVNPFNVLSGASYELKIAMKDGSSFSSDQMTLPQGSAIDSLYAERITNDFGEEGMAIYVDNINAQDDSKNFRYEYIETYKVIAPDWNSVALVNIPQPVCPRVIKTGREREERICYTSDSSNGIILASTDSFDENRVKRFLVRFVDRNNYILSHRYSILVKQYVQSNAAHSFYEALKQFSSSESLFSETQPGFLEGNLHSDDNLNRKVLGYFDVSKVSEKRIYFDYEDYFPGEELPPYADPCQRAAPKIAAGHSSEPRCILPVLVEMDLVRYVTDNPDYTGPQSEGGPFITVPRICGDCTVLGSTEIPAFWEE